MYITTSIKQYFILVVAILWHIESSVQGSSELRATGELTVFGSRVLLIVLQPTCLLRLGGAAVILSLALLLSMAAVVSVVVVELDIMVGQFQCVPRLKWCKTFE
jgi:hypothetical protein